jgi:anti-sigma regulatory factor (Ser/Thr protein kinase)
VSRGETAGQPGDGALRRVRAWFRTSPASVPAVRRWARLQVKQVLDGDRLDVFLLLLSEVVTNAVRHTRGARVEVELTMDGTVVAAVYDDSPDQPRPRRAGPDDTGGRGLALVDRLADGWGSERLKNGNRVWFRLAADPALGG